MFENVLLILADVAPEPFERFASNGGLYAVIAAVAAVVVGSVLLLRKKK